MIKSNNIFDRRKRRVRFAIKQKNSDNRLRLSVYRSHSHIYAQIINDIEGNTIVSASSIEKTISSRGRCGNIETALLVGKVIAERAIKKGIKTVVFDRGGYLFHGRIKALANAAREIGLEF